MTQQIAYRSLLDEAVQLLRDASEVINLPWHDSRRAFLARIDASVAPTKQVKVSFSESNSGGYFRMLQEDYDALADHGWSVQGISGHDRYSGRTANKLFNTLQEGIAEWEAITKRDSTINGCDCCGPSYRFNDWED